MIYTEKCKDCKYNDDSYESLDYCHRCKEYYKDMYEKKQTSNAL